MRVIIAQCSRKIQALDFVAIILLKSEHMRHVEKIESIDKIAAMKKRMRERFFGLYGNLKRVKLFSIEITVSKWNVRRFWLLILHEIISRREIVAAKIAAWSCEFNFSARNAISRYAIDVFMHRLGNYDSIKFTSFVFYEKFLRSFSMHYLHWKVLQWVLLKW